MGAVLRLASRGIRRTVGAAVPTAVLFSVAAPASNALTLREAMVEAARSNPAMISARAAARARHEGVPRARAAWLPTVTFTVDGAREYTAPHDTSPTTVTIPIPGGRPLRLSSPGRSNSRAERLVMELNSSVNLYRSGGDIAALRRAEEAVRHGHASVEDREQAVFLNVATVYLDTALAERVLVLRTSALAAFAERVRETEARLRVGDATLADLSQARAERDVANADVLSARADLEIQRVLFESRVGMRPRDLVKVGVPAGLPATLEAARQAAAKDRPAVRTASYAVRIAEQTLRAAQARFGPRLDLVGRARRTETAPSSVAEQDDVTVGLRLTVPLYQGGGAPVREAKKDVARLSADYDAARTEALLRATSAWHRLDAARRRLGALKAAAEASRTALAGVRRGAAVGERTTREVLDAHRRLLERRIQVLSAERNVAIEAYRLLEATGGLTAKRLQIEDLPDLEHEAREMRTKLAPGILDFLKKE